jgi:hypothetical protein
MLLISIRNIYTKNNISNYTYEVYINDKMIDYGVFYGHIRDNGWAKLVHDIAELHLNQSQDEEGE